LSKISNCLLMLKLLSSGRLMSVQQIADVLEVSPRMVRTYKQDLELAGFYINSINGKYGGYVYKNQDKDEITRYFSVIDLHTLESIFNRIKDDDSFDKNDWIKLLNIIEKFRTLLIFDKHSEEQSFDKNLINDCLRAIRSQNKIVFLYDKDGDAEQRKILPQNLYFHNNNYYLTGIVEDDSIRTFRLSKITKIIS